MSFGLLMLTILLPPLGLPLGFHGLLRDFKNWRRYILCLALFVGAIAYSYTPTGNSDLINYYNAFDSFANKSFTEAISYSGSAANGMGSGLVAVYAFYWLIGKIGDYRLASGVTSFVIYITGYYITCKIGEDKKIPTGKIVTYILFITLALNFSGIVNNIRNVFSFCLIGLAVFRDCYQKKRNIWTIALYIVPIFFHTSSILFIILRLLLILPRLGRIICSFALLFASNIINIFYNHINIFGSSNRIVGLFRYAIAKGYGFFNDTNSAWGLIVQRSGSYRLARILYISLAVIFFAIGIIGLIKAVKQKNNAENDEALEGFQSFTVYTSALTISCVNMLMPEYWRFASAMIVFGGSIYLFAKRSINHKIANFVSIIITLITPVCTALWVREVISASNEITLVTKSFISSPIIVFVMDLLGLLGL